MTASMIKHHGQDRPRRAPETSVLAATSLTGPRQLRLAQLAVNLNAAPALKQLQSMSDKLQRKPNQFSLPVKRDSYNIDLIRPVQLQAVGAARSGDVVTQLGGFGVNKKNGAIGGALALGGLGAAYGYQHGGYLGGALGLLGGAIAGGLAGGALGMFAEPKSAPKYVPTADKGSFAANLADRADFNREMERRLNLDKTTGKGGIINVNRGRFEDVSALMDAREAAQRGHVQNVLDADDGSSLYGDGDANAEKDALWRSMHEDIDAGTLRKGGEMSAEVKLKAKTSLARIIGTDVGQSLMSTIVADAAALKIPIRYEEHAPDATDSLEVEPEYDDEDEADRLTGLIVRLPSDEKYSDGQSIKRTNKKHWWGGGTSVGKKGSDVSVSPIDTEFYHEFSHAAHYLKFERRRRDPDIGDTPADSEAYDYDPALNEHSKGFNPVLHAQDKVAEARTIHRQKSYDDLRKISATSRDAVKGNKPLHTHYTKISQSMDHIGEITAGMWSENQYREALGLAPRQDHKAWVRGVPQDPATLGIALGSKA